MKHEDGEGSNSGKKKRHYEGIYEGSSIGLYPNYEGLMIEQ